MNRRATGSLLGLVCGTALVAALSPAGPPLPYEIDWHTVDAGGGISSGAGLEVHGTVGQHDAAPASTGVPFLITGGYWTVIGPAPCPEDCADGDGDVDVNDLLRLLAQWGSPFMGTGSCNFDGDVDVDVTDLLRLLAAWGVCP
jgi:hypothetical protein